MIRELVNDDGKVLSKAKTLMEDGKANLALQVLDVILANEYTNMAARTLRRDVLARLVEGDETLMSRNCWLTYMKEDEKFLALS